LEPLPFERFDRRTMRRVDYVRVDVERRLDARVPKAKKLFDAHPNAKPNIREFFVVTSFGGYRARG
jgi:hypothetical protein